MQGMACDEAGFEQLKQQVLTYALSEQISALSTRTRRNSRSKRQKARLYLLRSEGESKPFDVKELGRQARRLQSGRGKVLAIGGTTFRSNFECGNLSNVQQVGPNTFSIELERQTNSNRSSAWFYFSVEGVRGEAHFIVKGFRKSSSLYGEGMKVCYRDTREVGKWRRGGSRIAYTNSVDNNDEYQPSYELRFSHFFKNNEHTCIEFAYCFPYGLRKLAALLTHLKDHAVISVLTRSFCQVDLPLLTMGNPQSHQVLILSARVHPGETVSSFIMEGFLRELVADNQFGRMLLSRFLIKVVPMLNPDGVAAGNYRFSGFGCDLNRKWRTCKENQQPEVFFMRQLIRSMHRQRRVVMYIDMHGHSRKKHVFFYGCCRGDEQGEALAKPKQFPFLMEKLHEAYKYEHCCFNVQKDKEGTARVTVWKDLKIDYVYTLESTFCGPQFGPNYLEADYQRIGRKLCEGIALFFYSAPQTQPQQQLSHDFRGIERMTAMREKAFNELINNPTLLQVGDQDDSGSDSDPEAGEITEKERQPETGLPKPEALRETKQEPRQRKLAATKKFFSQSSISQKRAQKIKSEASRADEGKVEHEEKTGRDAEAQQAIKISHRRIDKVQIKIANTLTTFELDSLRASALYQKNVRVHSLTKHPDKPAVRSKRIVNPFAQEEQHQRLRVNLMHGRQGAQYRRVRKIAEQSLKKDLLVVEEEGRVVKQLTGSQFYMGHTERPPIAFDRIELATQQQRHRKASAQALRRGDFKKISINGDQFSVRCKGRQIYL